MNLSGPFIRRPVATVLLTIAVALAGGTAFKFLPIASLPQVDFPTISVQASLPGASPDIMASSVATPLERQFGHIAGVTEMTSASTLGSTSVTLQFDLNRDINGAARDVQAGINAARSYLPANLPSNPSYRMVNPADAPILILALTSPTYDRGTLYDAASTVVQQRLSQLDGVGQVIVGGSSLPAVRVELNPTQLNSYGLGLQQVAQALSVQNANLPKGQLSGPGRSSEILANDQLLKAADYEPLIIGYHGGAAVRLKDVARVEDSIQNIRSAGYLNGKIAVLVIVFRAPGANIIDTVDRIRKAMPSLKASIRSGIDMTVVLDRTTTIRASVNDVELTLIISVVLVVLVVFAFLRTARATLIPSVAVPVSLIGTFGAMYLLGYSLDNLSLMALTISTGFVVDDAIVVIENVTRHLEAGMSPMQAALRGSREIGFTVLSISVSLVAVFIPILLMGGIVGRLFREFAVTLSVAIGVSLALSLTTTPMMCSRLLRKPVDGEHGWFFHSSERIFNAVLGFYERTLAVVLRYPAVTLAVFLVTVAANVYLFVVVPKGFFPEQDNGTIFGGVQGDQGISFQALNGLTREFVDRIKKDPAVQNVMAFLGGGASNTGFIYVGLKPLKDRKISASQVINRLRPALMSQPGAAVFLQAAQDVRIGGRISSAEYQYTIQSENEEDLVQWGPVLLAQMRKLPGITDVNTDQENHGLETRVVYDRATASRMGITPQLMDLTLYNAFGQSLVSTMYTPLNQYYVVMEVAPEFWQDPGALDNIYLQPPGGNAVPLSAVARIEPTIAPLQVNHSGLFPSVTVSFNLAPGVALGEAAQAIQAMESRIGMPTTIQGMFSGTLEAFQQSLGSEPLLIITALLAVYIVLGILYESYIHPITILSTLPSAGVGAVLVLMLFHIELSVVALIGVILLIGIVKKNAILMIDFALEAERSEGMSPRDAIFQACLLRFRPILMTTLAAIFGAFPMAFGTGMGSELRRPLGISIIGGLCFSQVLTLYTTPVIYLFLDRLRHWWNRRRRAGLVVATAGTVLVLLLLLEGCSSVGPKYVRPAPPALPAGYRELTPADYQNVAGWKNASPKDDTIRGKWWKIFRDPKLSELEEQVNLNNQTIAAAFAAFQQARALVREASAQFFPSFSVGPSLTTSSGAATSSSFSQLTGRQFTQYALTANATWAPDLWGRIRDAVRQAQAQAQVSAADIENQRLLEQATLAVTYFELRAQDSLIELYGATVKAYEQSLELNRSMLETGVGSEENVAQAETQLNATLALSTSLRIARAQYEHAIALLIGKPATGFSLPPLPLAAGPPPAVPPGVPSELLERRPDIAAAERAMAAANAQIGIAQSAFYPDLTLNGNTGFGNNSFGGLLAVPTFAWTLGASLTELIIDGGLRRATVDQYRAAFEQTVANYRQTVLTAFQQVEDNLAAIRILSDQLRQEDAAIEASRWYLRLAQDRFRLGIDPYLNVVTAQIALLTSQQTALSARMQQLVSTVQLIEALGGGWDSSRLPSAGEVGRR